MSVAPDRPGWYPDPLKPATQERRWDGAEWTGDTREASVPVSTELPALDASGAEPTEGAVAGVPVYASWGKRVLAYLVDSLFAWLFAFPLLIAYLLILRDVSGTALDEVSRTTVILGACGTLFSVGGGVYNVCIRQGRTGYTFGKTVVGIRLVSEVTRQPIGGPGSFVRTLAHFFDGLCYVGFLWPIWDAKNQTFADKIMKTIVVVQPDAESSEVEQRTPEEEARSKRTTVALTVAIVLLLLLALVGPPLALGPLADEPTTISSDRPVLISKAAERSATDTAAKAAVAFAQRSYETYDEQVDEAAAMMTADFEKQFRQTTDDARDRFIEAETQVTAEVAAQGVMTASEQQVEALVFLNQFTLRKGEESVFTPFRLKVTLIDTEQGWLVSDVEAT
jgi:Mce-associated membrane protein